MELNQGHMDFQSIALPPELRYRVAMFKTVVFLIASAKVVLFLKPNKFFLKNFSMFKKKDVTLQSLMDKVWYKHAIRDVAQLVAHYVRDVGVGRSSRLIPTVKSIKRRSLTNIRQLLLFAFLLI